MRGCFRAGEPPALRFRSSFLRASWWHALSLRACRPSGRPQPFEDSGVPREIDADLSLVAPAAAAVAAAATTAAAAATAFGFRPRLVDGQRAAVRLLAVQRGNCRLGLLIAAHFHEAESLGTAGVPVHDD